MLTTQIQASSHCYLPYASLECLHAELKQEISLNRLFVIKEIIEFYILEAHGRLCDGQANNTEM